MEVYGLGMRSGLGKGVSGGAEFIQGGEMMLLMEHNIITQHNMPPGSHVMLVDPPVEPVYGPS